MIYFVDHMLTDCADDLYCHLTDFYRNISPTFDINHDIIAVCHVKEIIRSTYLLDNIKNGILKFLNEHNLSRNHLWLITNNTVVDHHSVKKLLPNWTCFDYFACWCYHRHNLYQHTVNTQWNADSGKALFLMGKPYKSHRIGLLYHLTQSKCFDNLVYSFDAGLGTVTGEMTQKHFALHCNDTNYDDFAHTYQRCLDLNGDITVIGNDGVYHYTGFPYDSKLFGDCSVNVVSETHFSDSSDCIHRRWITEKTWHAVLNRVPFILVDPGNLHNYLRELGIITYDCYYKYTLEDLITAHNTHGIDVAMQMYAEIVCDFLANYPEHSDQIDHCTKHNYGVVEEYYHRVLSEDFNNDIDLYDRFFAACAQGNL